MIQQEESLEAIIRAEHRRLLQEAFAAVGIPSEEPVSFSDTGYYLLQVFDATRKKITTRKELSQFLTLPVDGALPSITAISSEIDRLSFEVLLLLEIVEVLASGIGFKTQHISEMIRQLLKAGSTLFSMITTHTS